MVILPTLFLLAGNMKLTLLPVIGFRKRDSVTKIRTKSKIRQTTLPEKNKSKKTNKPLSKILKGNRKRKEKKIEKK